MEAKKTKGRKVPLERIHPDLAGHDLKTLEMLVLFKKP